MTASFTLDRPDLYPDGTTVKAYPLTNWPNSMPNFDAAPLGTETASATANGTGVSFAGLTEHTGYVAYASVGGVKRYVRFTAGEDVATNSDARFTTLDTDTQTGNYTLVLADAGKVVEINSATGKTVTVPTEANVGYPTGTVIELYQAGAGQVTIAGDTGVTVRSANGLKLSAQYSVAALRKRSATEWVASGDLTA